MKRLLLLLSLAPLVFLTNGCFLVRPLSFSDNFAGRFVRVDLRYPGHHEVLVKYNGAVIERLSTTQDQDHFYFFAKAPGTYEILLDGEDFPIEVYPPKWQVFIWMAADNSLREYVQSDLEEISSSGMNSSILVALDGASDEILAMSDEGLKVLKDTEIDSGSGSELREFVREFSIDPSRKFLIIWDHGSSWIGDSKYRNDLSSRAVALDEDSKDALTIPELSEALNGLKIDLLGFDACFMGSVEVVYQLRKDVNYIIASGDYEPGDGWNYSFLKNLSGSPVDVAKSAVNSYSKEYSGSYQKWSLSVFDTSKIDELVSEFKDIVSKVPTSVTRNIAEDLINPDSYKRYIKGVKVILKAYGDLKIPGGVVVYEWSNGGNTMNVLFPNPGDLERVYESYSDLEFASDTGWFEYLEEAGL